MRKANTAQAAPETVDLRARAATSRDAAGRFIKRDAPADDVDWHDPPPGFMASPAIEPFSFAQISEGIAIELGRLRGIALAEYERRTAARATPEGEERLRRELHLDVLSKAARGQGGFEIESGMPNIDRALGLAEASISELYITNRIADHFATAAYARSVTSACRHEGAEDFDFVYNSAGKLAIWLGGFLSKVEQAVNREIASRVVTDPADRDTWLSMRAAPIIDNGDPDQIEAFAHQLLDHAAAERKGR